MALIAIPTPDRIQLIPLKHCLPRTHPNILQGTLQTVVPVKYSVVGGVISGGGHYLLLLLGHGIGIKWAAVQELELNSIDKKGLFLCSIPILW